MPDLGAQRNALITAIALVQGVAVVTRNVAGFLPTEVTLLSPDTAAV